MKLLNEIRRDDVKSLINDLINKVPLPQQHPQHTQGKWRSRRTSCKLLKELVAAVGLEPTTYGL